MNNTIWFKDVTLEHVQNWMGGKNALEHMGIEFTELGPDFLEGTIPVDHRTVQPFGILHGGSTCLLAETLGSVASGLIINTDKEFAVGSFITANYLKKADKGIVTGIARSVHIGRSKHVWDISLTNDVGQLTAKCELTCAVYPVPKRIDPKT